MDKEEAYLLKHLLDLDRVAYQRNYTHFSDFLTVNEIQLMEEHRSEFQCNLVLYGGYEYAERQMVAFTSDAFSFEKANFPISCLEIIPIHAKFAESLTHRDILGSLMNLGIERSVLGDIILDHKGIYLLIASHMKEYFLEEFHRIRHTEIMTKEIPLQEFCFEPTIEDFSGSIASNRLDAFIALSCKLSRQKSSELILSEKVYINSKCITDFNKKLNPNDIISIRGFGKAIFYGFIGESKKGKLRVSYGWYR